MDFHNQPTKRCRRQSYFLCGILYQHHRLGIGGTGNYSEIIPGCPNAKLFSGLLPELRKEW